MSTTTKGPCRPYRDICGRLGHGSKDDIAHKKVSFSCALTWDGSRFDLTQLPGFARAYLMRSRWPILPHTRMESVPELLESGRVEELKICWVPMLAGGEPLGAPYPLQKRLAVRLAWQRTIGGHTLALYRPVRA